MVTIKVTRAINDIPALQQPAGEGVRRYQHRSPTMALGLTDHL
jgi:hypothetical protein